MKIFLSILLFAGLTRHCQKLDPYSILDSDSHPEYVHKMEHSLASDINSDDSATAKAAKDLMFDFEPAFRQYAPNKKVLRKLESHVEGMAVRVVGGNWCSDTKRELPRLCKVLYYIGMPVDSFYYYRVDKNKNAVESDFAASWTKGPVPDIIVYQHGKELGHIREMPQRSIEEDLLKILK